LFLIIQQMIELTDMYRLYQRVDYSLHLIDGSDDDS